MNLSLWYNEPAAYWEGALPLGNGKIGAMVFGGIETDRYQLNEDTIWSGPPEYDFNPDTPGLVAEARELIRQKRYSEATRFIEEKILLTRDECQAYQTAGDMLIDFDLPAADHSRYRRSLSLAEAVARVDFTSGGVGYSRESFASHPAGVICVSLAASQEGSLSFSIRLESPMPYFRTETISDDTAAGKGRAFNLNPDYARPRKDLDSMWDERRRKQRAVRYCLFVKAVPRGRAASIGTVDGHIRVERADSACIYVHINTTFDGYNREPGSAGGDLKAEALEIIARAVSRGYEELKGEHIADHRSLFGRVTLQLAVGQTNRPTGHHAARQMDEPTAQSECPTDERLRARRNPGDDPGLIELLFQYGRYLLIASSRPGSEPANLQGIWNPLVQPPWGSRYTVNINTEMNYWPAQVTNLPECERPLLSMIEDLSRSGRAAAEKLYRCRGWCSHHNTDLWRWSAPVQWRTQYAFWPMSGAWLARNIYEGYLFTGDKEQLECRGYEILKGSSRFMLDFLIENEQGELVISPSTSPENSFIDPSSREPAAACAGTAVDKSLVREIFEHTLAAAEIVGKGAEPICQEIRSVMPRLGRHRIGSEGQLLEYSDDFEEHDFRHRHVSHLFGVYPGCELNPDHSREFFEAAKVSLIRRGDKSTGWGMARRVALWARFLSGDRALSVIGNMLEPVAPDDPPNDRRGGVYINLMDAHPLFQIDGNFGLTAGIAEMLLQSHRGWLDILPALPSAWQNGKVIGLRARGGFEVDITWMDGELVRLVVKSLLGSPLKIRWKDWEFEAATKKGEASVFDGPFE